MLRARTLDYISISLHVLPALVLLSTHLAGVRTHSTLAYDLWYTDLTFRVRLYRAIHYPSAFNKRISIVSRVCGSVVSSMYLLFLASLR